MSFKREYVTTLRKRWKCITLGRSLNFSLLYIYRQRYKETGLYDLQGPIEPDLTHDGHLRADLVRQWGAWALEPDCLHWDPASSTYQPNRITEGLSWPRKPQFPPWRSEDSNPHWIFLHIKHNHLHKLFRTGFNTKSRNNSVNNCYFLYIVNSTLFSLSNNHKK